MSERDENQLEKPSKTQRKKEMLSLQELGETLIGLSPSQLAAIPLPDDLREEIQFAHTLTTRESKRRHWQYIGKLMRHVDPVPIQAALKKIQRQHQKDTTQFHHIEAWRERLITEGEPALRQFLTLHPEADRQHLRQLIRNSQQNRVRAKNTGGELALFRYLQGLEN